MIFVDKTRQSKLHQNDSFLAMKTGKLNICKWLTCQCPRKLKTRQQQRDIEYSDKKQSPKNLPTDYTAIVQKTKISLRYITFQINAFPRLVTPAVWWLSIRLVHSNGFWPREILTKMDICIFLWKRVRVREPQVQLIFWPNDLILCKNVFPFSSLPWDVLVGVVKIFA